MRLYLIAQRRYERDGPRLGIDEPIGLVAAEGPGEAVEKVPPWGLMGEDWHAERPTARDLGPIELTAGSPKFWGLRDR